MQRLISAAAFSAFFVLGASNVAHACSCGPTPNVLDSFESAKNVVIVTVTGVKKAVDPEAAVDGVVATTMHVDKVYKGRLKVGDAMTFAQGGGADCIWTFSERSIGERYLFYLDDRPRGALWIGFGCGRSNSVEHAGEDLLFLDKLDKVRDKTRISGSVQFDAVGDFEVPSAEGITLSIRAGGRTQKVKTDKNGVYEIYGLPPGVYDIIPDVPRGWRVNSFYLSYVPDLIADRDDDGDVKDNGRYRVMLSEKRHASVKFHLDINNALRGRVFGPEGNPMKGVCLRIFPPTGVTKEFMYNADCTDADGRYELDEIPPGNYIVVANDSNELSSSEPFPTLYYPGVFELERATVLSIGLGEFREGLDIRVPRVEQLVTITGRLLWADGKPVIDESVQFVPKAKSEAVDGRAGTRTDSSGRFTIKVLKGLEGTLVGSTWTYIGEFEKCPKLEAFIKSVNGRTAADVISEPVPVSATENRSEIELRLPFPGCRKAKD